MVSGELKAAEKPFMAGLAAISRAWVATWLRTVSSHVETSISPGGAKADPRRANGSSIDGRVLKNSTLAVKSEMVRPELGSMVIGMSALSKTLRGPSSERAKRMPKPPTPAIANFPSMPIKKTRWATGDTDSKCLDSNNRVLSFN